MTTDNACISNGKVTLKNAAFYAASGFLVAPDLLSSTEITELRRETVALFRGERGPVEGLLVPEPGATDEEVLASYAAIHFPHKMSAVICRYLSHPKIVAVLQKIVSPNLKCMQSMLFVKAPGKPGQSWHQDEYYIPTRDRSLTGVWIAIDDADRDNGCLWIIPGRPPYIMRRVRNDDTQYADVDTIDVSGWEDQALAVEVKSGSVVFFNGYTLHSSRRNSTADRFRMALVNHYMSAESMLPWDQDGKLPPTEDLRDIVPVAGEDFYAWKGLESVNRPYLRPDILNIKTDLK